MESRIQDCLGFSYIGRKAKTHSHNFCMASHLKYKPCDDCLFPIFDWKFDFFKISYSEVVSILLLDLMANGAVAATAFCRDIYDRNPLTNSL